MKKNNNKRSSNREIVKKKGAELGEKKVKEEALRIIHTFQILPPLLVFDLDFTLWPFYCECRPKGEPCLYPEAKGIICALKEKGIDLAIASRSATPHIANSFLESFGIKSFFVTKEIFNSSTHKTDHFQKIHSSTRIPFNSMLFFDDEKKNIQAVSNMGVTSIFVSNGFDLDALTQGLTEFSENWIQAEKNKPKSVKNYSQTSN
ncbi:hypothetical protein REPUB_Repub04eG0094200 [Reevesia pubescens]